MFYNMFFMFKFPLKIINFAFVFKKGLHWLRPKFNILSLSFILKC